MTSMRSMLGASLLATGLLAPQAIACGFDGHLGDAFSAQHPKSFGVAMAVADAVSTGALGREAIAPIEPGQKGYWRAMARVQRFSNLMSAAGNDSERLPAISVLLIDSGLWTRLRPGPSGYEIEAHAKEPVAGDVIIVTNEFVLASLDDGALKPARALDMGLVAVDGDEGRAASVRSDLIARIDASKDAGSAVRIAPAWGKRPSGT
jgi:hypothetical protein